MYTSTFKAITIALTVMFLISCGPKGADPQLVSKLGTSDQGGGGDVVAEKAVSTDEIIKMIEALKTELPPALYRAELALDGSAEDRIIFFKEQKHLEPERASQILQGLLPKLYSSPVAKIYSALKNVEFIAKVDGPCKDLQHQDKDGSAFNENPNEICLSVPRLQSRLTSHVAWSEILSLAAHELSHRADANEEEAQVFQFLIKHQSGLTTAEGYRSQAWYSGYFGKLSWQFDRLDETFKKEDPESISQLCSEIGQNKESLESIFDKKLRDISATGLLFERPHTLRVLRSAAIQSKFLAGFCGDENYDISEGFANDRKFDPSKPFPMTSAIDADPKRNFLNPSQAEGDLLIVKKHDWKAALSLYLQIKQNIKRYNDLVDHPEKSPTP